MNEPLIDTKLSIRRKKKKVFIIDGIISFPLVFSDDNVQCLCKDILKSDPHEICKHVRYFMYQSNLDLYLLDHWIRMRKHIVPQLVSKHVDNNKLWEIVDKEIFSAECPVCLDTISINKRYHVCTICQNISHDSCFRKWNKKGNGCAMCRTI